MCDKKMTPNQVKAIQESFTRIAPMAKQAADFMIGETCSRGVAAK